MDTIAARNEHNQGFHLHLHNRVAEAEPFYHRALALDPEFKEAWTNLGLALLTQGKPDEALSCHRHALQIDPEEIKLAKFELPAEPEVEESREKQLGLIDLGPDAPRSMRRGPDELEEFPEEEVDADAVVAAAAAKPAAEPTPPAGTSGGEET